MTALPGDNAPHAERQLPRPLPVVTEPVNAPAARSLKERDQTAGIACGKRDVLSFQKPLPQGAPSRTTISPCAELETGPANAAFPARLFEEKGNFPKIPRLLRTPA